LNYARPKPLHFRSVPPGLFVENAVRLARTQLAGKEIEFLVRGLPEDFLISADADRMQEVLLNLFLNSISAISSRGRIRVVLKKDDKTGMLSILVADNGAGIPKANLAQIFQPFFSTKKAGTGLGLSLCRKTVEAHGGTIRARSRIGFGTTFLLRLPYSRREAADGR
jgi:signal transduction histidine kinase